MQIKHTFLFTLVLGLGWAGYLFGYVLGPDPASNGIFGDTLACSTAGCHVGSVVNHSSGSMSLSGLPTSGWVPGQVYPLTITITRSASVVFGFQLSAVTDTGNQQAGTLTPGSNRVKVITSGGIQYAEHSNATVSPSPTFNVNWTAPSAASVGKVRFNLAGNAANGNLQNTGDFIYTRVDRVDPSTTPSPTSTLYFPHIVNGVFQGSAIWKTTILLTNPAASGGATATGTITFTKENATLSADGSAMTITFTDEVGQVSTGSTINFSIPPGQAKKYVSSGSGEYAGGFATVSSDTAVNGTGIFSEYDLGGQYIGEAGVPAGTAVARQAVFVDTVGGYNIGIAYANPGTSAANVTVQLVSATGEPRGSTTQVLGAGNHKAAIIGSADLLPGPLVSVGRLELISDNPLSAIALRFDPSFRIFTTLPPVTLASLINPAIEWFEGRPWLSPVTSFAKLLGALQFRKKLGEVTAVESRHTPR